MPLFSRPNLFFASRLVLQCGVGLLATALHRHFGASIKDASGSGNKSLWPSWSGLSTLLQASLRSLCSPRLNPRSMAAFLVGAYLPSYLDGSERKVRPEDGSRYWPWFQRTIAHPIAQLVLPKMELRFIWEDEKLSTKAGQSLPQLDPSRVLSDPVRGKPLPETQVLLCSHPHGVTSAHHPHYVIGSSSPSLLSTVSPMAGRRDLSADIIFRIPGFREFGLWLGMVSADRKVAKKVFSTRAPATVDRAVKSQSHKVDKSASGPNMSLCILVGGEAEQLVSERGKEFAFLRGRKGFARLAAEHGVPVVPIYVFGENDLCDTVQWLSSLRKWVSKTLRIAVPLPYTYRLQSTTLVGCFGTPIYPGERFMQSPAHAGSSQKPPPPSPEELTKEMDRIHAAYIAELIRVFEYYKVRIPGYAGRELEVM